MIMIKPISKIEAFELLLNKGTASNVYVKTLGTADYLQAVNYKFTFGASSNAINVHLADFYVGDREAELRI